MHKTFTLYIFQADESNSEEPIEHIMLIKFNSGETFYY